MAKSINPNLSFLFIFGLSIFIANSGLASGVNRPLSARQIGMGYSMYLNQPDPFLFFTNPVSLSSINHWSAGSSYTRLFNLKELGLTSFAGQKRFGNWVSGLGTSQFGFDLYREQTVAVGIAQNWNDLFAWGFAVRYQQITIKNYGNSSAMAIDVGWKYSIKPQAVILGSIQNINRATIGKADEALPQTIRLSGQFEPVTGVIAAVELFKELNFEVEPRFGLEAEVYGSLRIRGGITRNPSRFTGGFSLQVLNGRIDYGFSHHLELGYTHAMSLVFGK